MTPLERLLAEELPTGRFGGAEDAPASATPKPAHRPPGTAPPVDPDAAAHRAALLAALDEQPLRIGRRAKPTRHLRALPAPHAA